MQVPAGVSDDSRAKRMQASEIDHSGDPLGAHEVVIPITRPDLPLLDEYVSLLQEIWDSRMLSNFGPFAQRLEGLAASTIGVPVTAVVSGDIGLVLTIRALRLPAGSVAIVPSYTFNSTVNAVIWNNLVPQFVDIDPVTYTLDPESVGRALATGPVALIVATHTFGNPADTDSLERLAHDRGARLIFDAAHAYGSHRGGVPVGQFGDAEVFSLSGTKVVTSAEGGLISSSDERINAELQLLRGYGFYGDYRSVAIGLNGKMSELHAALGSLTLPRIEETVYQRMARLQRYWEQLEGCPVSYQLVRDQDRSTYKDFVIRFPDAARRVAVEEALRKVGVQTKRYFLPCHDMPAFANYPRGDLSGTVEAYDRSLCVPLFTSLKEDEIDMIARTIRTALGC